MIFSCRIQNHLKNYKQTNDLKPQYANESLCSCTDTFKQDISNEKNPATYIPPKKSCTLWSYTKFKAFGQAAQRSMWA